MFGMVHTVSYLSVGVFSDFWCLCIILIGLSVSPPPFSSPFILPLLPLPQYHYQDDESPPEHSYPRLTGEVRAPELVHVSERNLSEIENVHGYVSHSHISPLKVSTFTIRNTMRDCCHGLPYVFYSSSLRCCYYLDRSSPEKKKVLVWAVLKQSTQHAFGPCYIIRNISMYREEQLLILATRWQAVHMLRVLECRIYLCLWYDGYFYSV